MNKKCAFLESSFPFFPLLKSDLKNITIFAQKYDLMDYEENNEQNVMASEPSAALYYGSSTRLRESGIIPELSQLDKSDTLWIIRFCKGILR